MTSPTINGLSVWAERHFYRLLLCADDYGCFEATPAVIKGRCYALQRTTENQVIKWHGELEAGGVLNFWEAEGRTFGIFINFDKHNSKYCVTEDGKPTRHRRRTPEPPGEFFATFCQDLPNPNPNPKHNPKTPTKDEARKYYSDKLGSAAIDLEGVIYDFCNTRKTKTLTPKRLIWVTDKLSKFSYHVLMDAKREWNEKRYAREGKREEYFIGICRRLAREVEFRRGR